MIYTDEIGKRKIRDDIVGRSGRISGYMYSVVGGGGVPCRRRKRDRSKVPNREKGPVGKSPRYRLRLLGGEEVRRE